MKSHRPVLTALAAGLLAAFAASAFAAGGTTTTTTTESSKLATTYTTFAGSDANANALVDGLRNGTAITLETTSTVKNANGTTSTVTTPTTFQPATGKLGYGNVNIALALAEADLGKLGITDPTAAQIEAALNGGTVTLADGSTENLQGVLALRAQGEGWGQISKTLGTGKLGDVVSASKTRHSQAGATHMQHGSEMASSNRPEHPVHPDRPQRPDVSQHPEMPQHPQVPHRPDIPDHVGGPGH
ncbi:MAG: hypothetical protein EPN36_05255 [Rhodanobacteraceae bacterium]|nr:MAG: hypothetical protein EPN36_05255 [Rhodanobacteraceae bacterium]